jgi:hypothetical protein
MGLFGKMFGGGEPEYPALDPSNPASAKIDSVKDKLAELADQVKDPMEIVPADGAAYIFIGTPPKRFGIAWIEDGKINNFKTLLEQKGASPITLEKLSNRLREAYVKDSPEEKFSITIGDRKLTVVPSEALAEDVKMIIKHVTG